MFYVNTGRANGNVGTVAMWLLAASDYYFELCTLFRFSQHKAQAVSVKISMFAKLEDILLTEKLKLSKLQNRYYLFST